MALISDPTRDYKLVISQINVENYYFNNVEVKSLENPFDQVEKIIFDVPITN